MKIQLKQFWQARSRSERILLLAWSGVVAVALMYFGLLSPLYGRLDRLEKSIPVLENQLFAMRSQPAPGGGMRPSNPQAPGDLRSSVFRFLADQQLTADVRSLASDRVEVRLPEMPADNALSLLQKMRQETEAKIAGMSMKRDAEEGPVQTVVEMERKQ